MKIVASLLIVVSTSVSACKVVEQVPVPEPREQKACIIVYDAKAKKEVEKCRTIKIQQPYEGTPIPKK